MAQESLFDSVRWHLRSWDQIKRTSLFTLSNYANVFMFLFFIAVGLYQIKSKRVRGASHSHSGYFCGSSIVLHFRVIFGVTVLGRSSCGYSLMTHCYFEWRSFTYIGRCELPELTSFQDEAKKRPRHSALKAPDFPEIEELRDFDWKTTEPIKLRPFKPKYHITMGRPPPLPTPPFGSKSPSNPTFKPYQRN